uniref:ShKT domain-containing protein n=2 Tax=Strongyloides stercoralis TaxID=6248 RepID=A0A0K0DWP5_STRER
MKFLIFLIVMFITLPLEVKSATCAQMAENGYCKNPLYRKIMCSNCAKECNPRGGADSCELPVKSSACSDVATNCESLKYLCTNPTYANVMAKNCMSTCNTCNGVPATTTTTVAGGAATTPSGANAVTTEATTAATTKNP